MTFQRLYINSIWGSPAENGFSHSQSESKWIKKWIKKGRLTDDLVLVIVVLAAVNTVDGRRVRVVIIIVAVVINTDDGMGALEVWDQTNATIVSTKIFGSPITFTTKVMVITK